MPLTREQIAQRAAKELGDGDYVNLGVGIPILVASYVPSGVEAILHSAEGILGIGPFPAGEEFDPDLYSVSTWPATVLPGASFFSTADAFGMVRSGRIDVAIMGALEVSERGDIASWMIPGATAPGMGGAMDLVAGAKRLIVAMEHVTRAGKKRIVKRCTLPLTGVRCVSRIITDYCVLDVTSDGLELVELVPGITLAELQALTEPALIVKDTVTQMVL